MNAERLRAIADFLLEVEKKTNVQGKLDELVKFLENLAASPTPENQVSVSQGLESLAKVVHGAISGLNSAQRSSIALVNATRYFDSALIDVIKSETSANAITPAIALKKIEELVDQRKTFLNVLRNVRSGLRNLGIEPIKLDPGHANIAVLLPRKLFHNDLDGLQKELRTLSSIIRTFYEISNVTPGPIELREISASDPTFFLGIDVAPLIALGLAIKWCIDVVKGSHDIKKIADDARRASVTEDIVRKIEDDIQKKIEARLDARVSELLGQFKGDTARKNELESPTRFALEQLLQRIERGMVVEIHCNPPAIEADSDQGSTSLKREFDELEEIAASLEFPKIEGEPMLQLTTGDDTPEQILPR